MSIQALIENLATATGPDRSLDSQIAMLTGHRGATSKIPYYTSSLDNAYELATFVAPSHVGACRWEGSGIAAAQINDQEAFAATPALALCIAALRVRGQ